MTFSLRNIATAGLAAIVATPAFAMEAPANTAPAVAAAEAAATIAKGDTAWMIVATVLVMAMIVPGVALFYGGLARTKNMASVLTQVLCVSSLAMLIWVMYGYSMAFGDTGNAFIADFGKVFLKGVTADSGAATFSDGVEIPEYIFIAFQMTFAAITAALIVGGTMERAKLSTMMVFTAIWLTIVYFPIAHMVWATGGLIFEWGALDFAGGTVVHINAGVSALVGCLILGKRIGYPKEPMPPHSLTMTLLGTGLLWVGWFGFNGGSELEADGVASLAVLNTFVATAAGVLFWMLGETISGHKGSLLGGCSGAIAGLVAVTPAAGNSGPFGAILIGAVAALVCFWFVTMMKPKLGLDDSADVFGIHGIGGIVGSLGTAFTMMPGLGGPGDADYNAIAQLIIQAKAVGVAIVWAAVGASVAWLIAKLITGGRVSEEKERDGLDLSEHGERAYNY
ncbi:MAG: ammonia channel protein [Citromicrobium sp.]|mgnify:FL=1|nr:ammonia channel protein [Citromicrobium sp.]MBD75994.1 ammonia channel protein [Citromicrobium sp.]MBT47641.1 ammonia channel protein [Citromicrobium sp.]|tara:strand:+ start:300 stop:1655 length:1356 start_codon:yes stop_codon:yes gene_type:complete